MARLELSVRNQAAIVGNIRAFDAELQSALVERVGFWGEWTQAMVALLCPVDTGFMRDHIRLFISEGGKVFEVGWDASDFFDAGLAFYPFFVEYGTVKMAAQPSLGPAYAQARPLFEADVSRVIRESIARSAARRRSAA